ncbi:MAG: hypothetical protein U5K76_10765 [Woeseiaceae bacterium]|nr:hypothetical protein [Woeseiaceae bacterium]
MQTLLRVLAAAVAVLAVTLAGALWWLHADAHRERADWFELRRGSLQSVTSEALAAPAGTTGERVRVTADTGLSVQFRVLRPAGETRLPVLLLLGGHQTGSAAVELFGAVTGRAVVAFDYPYDGPASTRGVGATLAALPAIRRAFLDAAPAIWLALDWITAQQWSDPERVVMSGVSLGVPFAATAAAHDPRIDALLLVHGAADNRAWIEKNLSRELDAGMLQPALATLLNWLVYGPLHDTARHVAAMSPRPVVIVGAREDERAPVGATERLYGAAREPKSLHWTEGQHVQPSRPGIVDALLSILDDEMSDGVLRN